MFNRKFAFAPLGLLVLVASTASQAAIDVSAVTTEITGTLAPVAAIGAGVLIVIVSIAAFKWVKRAIS